MSAAQSAVLLALKCISLRCQPLGLIKNHCDHWSVAAPYLANAATRTVREDYLCLWCPSSLRAFVFMDYSRDSDSHRISTLVALAKWKDLSPALRNNMQLAAKRLSSSLFHFDNH